MCDRHVIPAAQSLPAIGQGILAIEYLAGRSDLADLLAGFEDRATACAARAERAVGRVVEGSCEVPVGAYAAIRGETTSACGQRRRARRPPMAVRTPIARAS